MKFNVCEHHTKLPVYYHFVYCRTNTMDALQETYVHFWAHIQSTRQTTRVRKQNHSIDPPNVPREKQNKYRTRKS